MKRDTDTTRVDRVFKNRLGIFGEMGSIPDSEEARDVDTAD